MITDRTTPDRVRRRPSISVPLAVSTCLLLASAVVSGSAEAGTTASDICPGLPPICTVTTSFQITPNSVLDFGTSELQINGGTLQAASGARGIFTITASALTVNSTGKILAKGSNSFIGGRITINTTGNINIAGKVDVSGPLLGGELLITAGGTFTTTGKILAKGSNGDASGGFVFVTSDGDLTTDGQLSVFGGIQSEGGFVSLTSSNGDAILLGELDLRGGGSGGEIAVEAINGDIFFDGGSKILLQGTGGCSLDGACGDGGFSDWLAGRDTLFFGRIQARPNGDDTTGGAVTIFSGRDVTIDSSSLDSINCSGGGFDGGEIDLTAGRDLMVLNGRLQAYGDNGGSGGAVTLTAGETLSLAEQIFADGRGVASAGWQIFGGDVALFATGDASVSADIDATGKDGGGGPVEIFAAGNLAIGGTSTVRLDTRSVGGGGAGGDVRLGAGQSLVIGPDVIVMSDGSAETTKAGAGGKILLDGCNVTTDPTVEVTSLGEAAGSLIEITMHDTGTIAGIFDATGTVPGSIDLLYRLTAPNTSGATFTPAATVTNNPALAPCPRCGDSIVQEGETCDDGNNIDGDCCSSTCQREPNGSPCDDGSVCTTESCLNGFCIPQPVVDCAHLGDIDCSGQPNDPNQPDSTDALTELCLFVGICNGADLPAPCNDNDYRLSVGDWNFSGQIDSSDSLTTLGIFVGLVSKCDTPLGACCCP